MSRIESITTRIVRLPMSKPIVTATVTSAEVWLLLVSARTADGEVGDAYIWSYNANISRSLQSMVGELSRHAIGADPTHSARIWSAMWKGTVQWGHAGITVMATAALDIAIWDLAAKRTNLSVGKMLGLRMQSVQTYASHGLWITDDLSALEREAAGYVADGFRAMKMRAGRKKIEDDVAAVRAVREAIGPNVGLMVDFGSAPSRDKAERMGFAMEEFNLLWIEDPVVDEHPEDHAELARLLRTPVCFGEKVYSPQGFARLIEARCCDHLMADLQRAGGVTAWVRIAAMADAARMPLSTHIMPELNVQLVASAPTGTWLEYLPWAEALIPEHMQLRDGQYEVPDRPGFGIRYDDAVIEQSLQDTQVFRAH